MKATITLLGRATAAEDFAPLWTGTAEVGDGTVSVMPVVPVEAMKLERVVEVASPGSVSFAAFGVVPARPKTETDEGAAQSLVRRTSVFATLGAKARRVPFNGCSIVALCRTGTPQPTA